MKKHKTPKDISEFLKSETKPYYTKFWGQRHFVKPALVEEFLGDGRQVIYLEPLDTRPSHYVLRIDSQTDITADDFNFEELIQMAEAEYGSADDYDVKYNAAGHYVCRHRYPDKGERWKSARLLDFPMVNWSGGKWGVFKNFGPLDKKILSDKFEPCGKTGGYRLKNI